MRRRSHSNCIHGCQSLTAQHICQLFVSPRNTLLYQLQYVLFVIHFSSSDLNIKDLLAEVNLQHRCATFNCPDSGRVTVRQEREDSNVTHQVIKHLDDLEFVVNALSFHNTKYLNDLFENQFDVFHALIPASSYEATRNSAAAYMRENRLTLQPKSGKTIDNKGESDGECFISLFIAFVLIPLFNL